jgi:bacillithiol synthase
LTVAGSYTYLPYKDTGYFSHLVTDYLDNESAVRPFYSHRPTAEGLAAAINDRKQYNVDRRMLVEVLNRQYECLDRHDKVVENIQLLLKENTFTICTAHQPNLLTGYLYFVYKILHAIKLAEELSKQRPDEQFVPVYYIGSEDNDLDELGTFRFRGKKYMWDGGGQKGAIGRMRTETLKPLLNELFKSFGPPGRECDELQKLLTAAYAGHKTVGEATRYLVNELFGRYGLVVIDPDEAALKRAFIPVMEDELLHQQAHPLVTEQVKRLEDHYKIQAHPRLINLFYLVDGLRERIEVSGDSWSVVNTDKSWTKNQLLEELRAHPERFSPNVVLRPLFQETILPNVAFIGGGAEVAYWLQLKTLFAHYKVPFPSIHLRQSVLWINEAAAKLRSQLGFEMAVIFKSAIEMEREYMSGHSREDWQTNTEVAAMEKILRDIKHKAIVVDATLGASAEAALAKMKYQLQILEKKMLRAEKRKMDTQVQRIERLKSSLFPNNSLQERVENFMEYYLQYGMSFFDTILAGINPMQPGFLVIERDAKD